MPLSQAQAALASAPATGDGGRTAPQAGAIWLVGMMGAGKSTVGRLLAEALGRPFVDSDRKLEEEAGKTVHEIFADGGEGAFRAREAELLRRLASIAPNAVIATGGGAPCHGDLLDVMQRSGLVVWLRADVDDVFARIDVSKRPLLAGDDPRRLWQALDAERRAVYARAGLIADRGVRSSSEVAADIVRWLADYGAASLAPEPVRAVWVELGSRRYPIFLDEQPGAETRLAAHLGQRLPPGRTRLGIVTDENVAALHLPRLRGALLARGYNIVEAVVPAGEASKSLAEAERVANLLVEGGLDRGSAVLALGGGVVGDLAGFVASLLFRGVDFVQVPTTLMAMVDSSIGGKTGVNLAAGKNLAGRIHQPVLVYADLSTLATLPARDLSAGLGEVLKHALLEGGELLEELGAVAEKARAGDAGVLARIIAGSCAIKARVVASDELERDPNGGRALLNLGHTVGHALESASHLDGHGLGLAGGGENAHEPSPASAASPLRHGEAVGLGLLCAARIARLVDTGHAPAPGLEARIAALLARLGLPADLERHLSPASLAAVRVDKKRAGGVIRYIALPAPGVPRIVPIEPLRLVELLTQHAPQHVAPAQPTPAPVSEVTP